MITKIMPHQKDAEQRILGILFMDISKIQSCMDLIDEKDFYLEEHQRIFEAMKKIYIENKTFDYVSVSGYLKDKNILEKIGGIEYLYSLSDMMPSSSHLEQYIRMIKDARTKRDIINFAGKIIDSGYSGDREINEFVDYSEEGIFEITKRRRTSGFTKLSNITSEVKMIMERNSNKQGITGLRTGFSNLDSLSAGLQPEELIILAARPSMGKSAFAMNLAINVAKRNKEGKAHVAIFSLEMSNNQLVSRMLSSEGNIRNTKIKTGSLSQKEWQHFETTRIAINDLNIHFDDSGSVTVQDIRAKCRKLSQEDKLDFVVIDYLQLIKSQARVGNRQEEVANISRSLKQMARELKVPVLALSQLSRDVEKRDDKRPVLADLRESGSIEQDSDIVLFLYRQDFYKKSSENKTGDVELIIAKNRQGIAGVSRYFRFDTEYSRFTAQADRQEEYKPQY